MCSFPDFSRRLQATALALADHLVDINQGGYGFSSPDSDADGEIPPPPCHHQGVCILVSKLENVHIARQFGHFPPPPQNTQAAGVLRQSVVQ